MKNFLRHPRHLLRLSCIVGGVCLGLSYPPIGLVPLGWIALAPAFVGVVRSDRREAFVNAWLLYLACFSIAFYWPLFHVRTDTSLISALAWLALTMLHAVPFGVGAVWSERINGTSGIWITGAMVLIFEWFLTEGPVPMPWSLMGNSQAASVVTVASARFVGVSGLSLLIVIANLCFALAFVSRSRKRIAAVAIAVFIPLVSILVGALPNKVVSKHQVRQLRVGILQPGYSPAFWSSVYNIDRVDSLIALSDAFLDDLDTSPDLLIWPETTLPVDTNYSNPDGVFGPVSEWTTRRNLSLLTGAVTDLGRLQPGNQPDRAGPFENSVILFEPDSAQRRSGKNILVPFAEYVPFSELLSVLVDLAVPAGGVRGYVPGSSPSVFSTNDLSFGVLICFESVFPAYARRMALMDVDFLVVVTQDGWWKGTASYDQHLYFNRIRSIELGLPIVQVGVDGLSALILPDGQIFGVTAPRSRAAVIYDVPITAVNTVYRRIGNMPAKIVLGIWILFSLLYAIRSRHSTQ